MINFTCRCGNKMQAPDDEAGLTRQCQRCGLLVDVPTAAEREALERDGTYRLDKPDGRKPDENLDQLKILYFPGTKLPDGTEIDLRGPVAPMSLAPISDDQPPPARPKYDPSTGELITEMGVGDAVKPRPTNDLPEAQHVIDYNVSMDAMGGSPHGMGIFAALFQPLNVIVMTMIFVAHIFLLMSMVVATEFVILIVIPFAVLVFLMAHYGTVVEEMGPAERDELPRPLRNVHPFDDFVVPFAKVLSALLLCYWPIGVILLMNFAAAMSESAELPFPEAGRWLLVLWPIGSTFFPAVLLTICTAGSLANLRPDRLLRLMGHGSWQYVLFVLLWVVTGTVYLAGVVGTYLHVLVFFSPMTMPVWLKPFVPYPLLLAGIYLAHSFCWLLGSYYRQEWRNFPWAAQVHVRKTISVARPVLHPKVAASDRGVAERAARRGVR